MLFGRAIARQIIRGMVGEGFIPAQIMRTLKKQGYSYRKKDMLNDIRERNHFHKYQKQTGALHGNMTVPQSWINEMDLKRPYRYRVFGNATYYDETLGGRVTKQVSFYTDDFAKKEDWQQGFMQTYRQTYEERYRQIMDMNIVGVQHNKGMSY